MVSTAEINRLGQAIRERRVTSVDLELLGRLYRDLSKIEESVSTSLIECTKAFEVSVSSRVKNSKTIEEKLQRLGTKLGSMRDLVGCRVVVQGDRFRQYEVLLAVVTHFQDHEPKLINRIADPRVGYRALHLEIRHHGQRCEIQIRTHLQHDWARSMEMFADIVGNGVKYKPGWTFPGLPSSRRLEANYLLEDFMRWSDAIHRLESFGDVRNVRDEVEELANKCKSRMGELNDWL
jgi:(p)ppGpp synthase/HD superfamily hydrolase